MLRYPEQARGIRAEYLIEIVNAFNIEVFLAISWRVKI